jgi:hypothetical protein
MNTQTKLVDILHCSCGEAWVLSSDSDSVDFYTERAKNRIQRFMHRAYQCPLTTFNMRGGL